MVPADEVRIRIRLLGGFAVSVMDRPVPDSAWRLRRAKTLVKLLGLAPDRRMHRDQVTELLWPDGRRSGNGLHQVLYTARRALGSGSNEADPVVSLRDDIVALRRDDVGVDVEDFERAAATAREQRTVSSYRAALALYGGELLPEDRYEDWSGVRRESLGETHLSLLVELAQLQVEEGDVTAAVEALGQAVVVDPLHEPAHRALMRAFASSGRRQQALAQYQRLRHALRRELEADPDPESSRLYREILAAQHNVQPAHEQLLDPDALPRETDRSSPRRHGHQHYLTSFVGRERELARLRGELARARLLTLTGPGGCGKTRLALELASQARTQLEHGVAVAELASLSDPRLVPEEAAAALGLQVRSERDPLGVLAEQIGGDEMLLVLDNCEHVIDAVARLAHGLLTACAKLTILATSRERLGIPGEVIWRVPPLSLPDTGGEAVAELAELERSEAIRLFCQRAQDAVPGFALGEHNAASVAEICRRLDGMPLALELAAARTSMLSPAQLADRLRDALALLRGGSRTSPTRQQTVRATLDWSHRLLTGKEQVLYRRLGMFAGSFDVDAVEGVCAGNELASGDALELLAQLVDKSLVQVEAGGRAHRYHLLETVRQDACERLAAAGEAERIEAAHRAWYLTLAQAADRDVAPDVAKVWPMERLEDEYDNVRAALASGLLRDPPAALRLSSATWWFWMERGLFVEGWRWLEEVLAAAPEPNPERARALFAKAAMGVRRLGETAAVQPGSEALEIARRGADRGAEARALERFGAVALGGFRWDLAGRAYSDGLALARALGDELVAVAIMHAQGVLAACRGQTEEARVLLGDSLAALSGMPDSGGSLFWAMRVAPVIVPSATPGALRFFFEDTWLLFRSVSVRGAAGYVLSNIAETWRCDGQPVAARETLERALALFRELDDTPGIGMALNALGNLARTTGDHEAGQAWFDKALAVRRAAGNPRDIATTLLGNGLLSLYSGQERTGRQLIEHARAIFERTEDAPGLEAVPMNLGAFELDAGHPERALPLLERCVELSRRRAGHNRHLGWALAELAEAAIGLGDRERASAALDQAMAEFDYWRDTRGPKYVGWLRQVLPPRDGTVEPTLSRR